MTFLIKITGPVELGRGDFSGPLELVEVSFGPPNQWLLHWNSDQLHLQGLFSKEMNHWIINELQKHLITTTTVLEVWFWVNKNIHTCIYIYIYIFVGECEERISIILWNTYISACIHYIIINMHTLLFSSIRQLISPPNCVVKWLVWRPVIMAFTFMSLAIPQTVRNVCYKSNCSFPDNNLIVPSHSQTTYCVYLLCVQCCFTWCCMWRCALCHVFSHLGCWHISIIWVPTC